jgi:proteasome activator subunit 4
MAKRRYVSWHPADFAKQFTLTESSRAEFKRSSHTSWGRLYEVKDVKIEWHVATAAEIDFTLELLKDLVVPALNRLESLLAEAREVKEMLSFEWVNDFCRVRPACLLD